MMIANLLRDVQRTRDLHAEHIILFLENECPKGQTNKIQSNPISLLGCFEFSNEPCGHLKAVI